jgi:hypothetical protein
MTAQGGVRPINAGLGDLIEFNSRQLGDFEPLEADFCPFIRIGLLLQLGRFGVAGKPTEGTQHLPRME